ncbi:MAG: DUF3524 domain-containing protein [Natronospirillum sp.]|uniref:tRNA-queuosine alpha-mannosyltransferase domain-containing protein n=1 Tax=Natronospirillum sp. TaxID=2812955 RepID=UPI0025F6ACC9|nr:DUF3524 domain-containing protein [Natronospirillum sp.]MCH8552397.1 DUF3524 domain-containing protein [Natronospirillum sp.]
MRALLLSAYHADSHRRWAEGVMRWLGRADWTLLDLPGRHFAWRMRGNPLTWHTSAAETLSREYDLILATSMVDLATLIGLYPNLGSARKLVYFHENQFAYPLSPRQKRHAEPLMVSIYSALAADQLLFNSDHNLTTFMLGAREFLRRMPERLDLSFIDALEARSQVLPVPLEPLNEDVSTSGQLPQRQLGLLLWNHRWEHDKNPDLFFAACRELDRLDVPFQMAVAGQQFRQQPSVFDIARDELAHRITHWGTLPRAEYRELLTRASIVVSTADHEFQGLAMLEAVQAGCVPLVPKRLCYPEFYATDYCYDGGLNDLVRRLSDWLPSPSRMPGLPEIDQWEWPVMLARYEHAIYDNPESEQD